MKIFALSFSFFLFTLISCKVTKEQKYQEFAQDTCDCLNQFTADLSPGMIELIIASEGDQAILEEKMMDYVVDNPDDGMKDIEILQDPERSQVLDDCMKKVEKEHESVKSKEEDASESEVIEKMILKFQTMENCKCAAAIMKLGMNAE